MKNFIQALIKGKIILIILTIVGFLAGFLYAYHFCKDTGYILINFKYMDDVIVVEEKLTSTDTIEKTKNLTSSLYTGNSVSTYKHVNITSITLTKVDDYYQLRVNNDAFNSSEISNASSTAKGFMRNLALIAILDENYDNYKQYDETFEAWDKNGNVITDADGNIVYKTKNGIYKAFDVEFYESNSLDESGNLLTDTDNYRSKMMTILSFVGASIGLLASLITLFIFSKKHDFEINHEYGEDLYKHPFHLSSFKESAKSLKDVRSLVTIAILLSFVMVCKFIPIPSGFGALGITFGFLFLAIACMIYGPVPALIIGLLSDIIGFIIKPTGPFFPGYTLDAILSCFMYALCFYKTHITFTKVLVARTFVNIFINGFCGSLWSKIMYNYTWDQFMTNMLLTAIPKNVAYLLPQAIILFIILKAITPALKATNHIDPEIQVSIF